MDTMNETTTRALDPDSVPEQTSGGRIQTQSDTLLPQYRHGKRQLTEKQMLLLDLLPSCNYDPIKAAEKAGYASPRQAVRTVREEITIIADDLIANNASIAAKTLIEILQADKPIPNIKEKITVAQDLLDRAGHAKKTVVDVNHEVKGGIFIIPEKKEILEGDYEIMSEKEENE